MNTPNSQDYLLHDLYAKLADDENPGTVAAWVKIQYDAGLMPLPDENWEMMRHALDKGQIESIPYLHKAGWKLGKTPGDFEKLGKTLGIGRWPYPELIAPDCLAIAQVRDSMGPLLLINMFFQPEKPWGEHLRKLDELDCGQHLKGQLSGDLGEMANMAQIDDLPYSCLDGCAHFMLQREWVQPDDVLGTALRRVNNKAFNQWFTGVVASQIEQNTPMQQGPSRSLRL